MQFLEKKRPPLASTERGRQAEDHAWAYLQAQGLRLLQRNYRTPGRGGGEIDLICQTPDGTVVFVEVRSRTSSAFGGAAASISAAKRRRIVFAARHWWQLHGGNRPSRFDVVTVQGPQVQWLPAAFDADA